MAKEQIAALHGEVGNAAVKMGAYEHGKEVCCDLRDELVCGCDWPEEEVAVLHGEVGNAAIKLGTGKDGKEVRCIIQRQVGWQTGQSHIGIMGSNALIACKSV